MEKLGAGDPQRIGAYRLLARLGAGGMGHVYLARSGRGRTVAVKLVRQELAEQEVFRARFRQEVQAARRVGGHWTAPVLDADTEAPVPWVATGYVAGPSLQTVVGHEHGALPERSVRILAAGLAHALKDIHAAGLIHRDLKPSNVLVTIDGPRVIDFGIARALETVADGGLTRTGALVGSPGFMSPEQVRGDRITPACDIFSLGSVLAYAATGRMPFGSANSGAHALMFRVAQEEPDLEDLPEGMFDLVRDCLRKDPEARPSLDDVLRRSGAEDTVLSGRSRDPWLPGALVAQLGRHAVQLLDTEDPEDPEEPGTGEGRWPEAAGSGTGPRSGSHPGTGSGAGSGPGSVGGGFPSGSGSGFGSAGGAAAGSASGFGSAGRAPSGTGSGERASAAPEVAPEHASAAPEDGSTPPPPGAPGGMDVLPTRYGGPGHAPTPSAPPAAYGYPHPQHAAYGPAQGGWGAAPAGYGPGGPTPHGPAYGAPHGAPQGATPPYGPVPVPVQEHRSGRSTAALVAVALVVALGAGGSVYALMKNGSGQGGDDSRAGTSNTATTDPGGKDAANPSPSADGGSGSGRTEGDGAVPDAYLGTWNATFESSGGRNTRRLVIRQGGVGDAVLALTAEGPTDGGTYRCEFAAELTDEPSGNGPLRIGPSTVTDGRPRSSCSPGAASEITLLPDGSLRRVNDTGESLTYRKAG